MQYVRTHLQRSKSSRRQVVVDNPGDLSPWEITVWTDGHLPNLTWRDKIFHFVHSERVHYVILALLILDVCLVIISIALEIEIVSLEVHECENVVEVCQDEISDSSGIVSSSGSTTGCHYEPSHHVEHLQHVEHTLAIVSISILSLFLLENLTLLFAKPAKFIGSYMQMLDLFVIAVSLVLEIVFQQAPEGGLLIIARSWRFFRISHGIYESREDEHLEHLADVIQEADEDGTLSKAYRALKASEKKDGQDQHIIDAKVTKLLLKSVGLYLTGKDPFRVKEVKEKEHEASATTTNEYDKKKLTSQAGDLGPVSDLTLMTDESENNVL